MNMFEKFLDFMRCKTNCCYWSKEKLLKEIEKCENSKVFKRHRKLIAIHNYRSIHGSIEGPEIRYEFG